MESNSCVGHILCGYERGGISTVFFSLIRDKKRFNKLKLIALKKTGLIEEVSQEGIQTEIIPAGYIINPFSLAYILRSITKNDIKIIHTHSVIPHIYGFLIKVASKLLGRRISLLVHVHADIYRELASNVSSAVKRKIYYRGVGMALKMCDIAIANSEAVKANLISRGINPGRIRVIYNGINLKNIENEAMRNKTGRIIQRLKGKKVIGTIGRMTPIKNYELLITASKKVIGVHKDVVFIMIGDGKEREYLEKKVSELALSDHFIFTGWMDSPYSILSLMDIFTLTSTYEGLGLVILEAMALKKPVVATEVGGVPEILINGETGILIPSGDVDALAAALLKLLNDPILRQKMGDAGNKVVREKFSIGSMVNEIEGIYSSLVGA